MKTNGVLVVVDDSQASNRAVAYAGRLLANCMGVDIHLVVISANLPARLLEFGGSEVPEKEERLEAELHRRQSRWIASAEKRPDEILDSARELLLQTGVDATRISTCVSSPRDLRADADEILLLARDEGCDTVVVGQRVANGEGEKLAHALVQRAANHTIWVVD